VYLIVKRGESFFLERLKERFNEPGTVYLDSWREWKFSSEVEKKALLAEYDEKAVIFDENASDPSVFKVHALKAGAQLPPPSVEGDRRYIGYPYVAVMRTMPIVKDEKMAPVNMSAMCVRMYDGYAPYLWGNECSKSDLKKILLYGVSAETNILSGESRTKQIFITHDAPTRACVLSIYTEV